MLSACSEGYSMRGMNTPGKISKFISKGIIDMKLLINVGHNPLKPHMQRNQTIYVHKLCKMTKLQKKY